MKLKTRLKDVTKALPPIQSRGLRSGIAAALILHFTLYILHSPAAEPLCWERRPNRPAPAQFDTFHGETLELRCAFEGFGVLPFGEGADVRLWYQTNGMGAAWWSVPATVASNTVSAAWPPSADPGAERVAFFFGAPSNAYAAAQVRFRNSPGPYPNDLEPPSVLDWQAELAAATNGLASALTGGSLKVAKAETADSAAYAESASEAGWADEAARAYKADDAEYIYKEIDQISGGGNTGWGALRFSYDDIANIKMTADAASNGVDAINNALPTNVAAIVTNSHAVVESWTFSGASYDPDAAYSVNVIPQGNGLYKYELSTNGIFVCYAAFSKYDDPYLTDYPYYTQIYFLWGISDNEVIADASSYHMENDIGLATTNYTDAAITAATNALGRELRAEMGADIGALRDDLTTGAVEVASAKRAYGIDTTNGVFGGDWIVDSINELKGGERLTTNTVCNIVTATVEKAVDRWSVTTNDAPVLGSAVKFIYQRDANRDLTYRDIYVYFPGYVPPVGYFDAGDMQRVMFHQFNQFAGVHTNDVDVTFTISLSNIPTEEYRYLSGATARLRRITSINALGLARLIDIPTDNEELANGAAYIALEPDVGGERTALTVGSRTSTNRGTNSVAFGQSNSALGTASFAQGSHNSAPGGFSVAMGRNATSGSRAFTWNQGTSTYSSHGTGTFNINPQNGIYGMYIGDSSLYDILLSAIGNRSTNTVTFLDEDGNVEDEEVYPPLGVAKSEDLIPIQNSVNAMWATMYGENVWIAITNYMRQVPGTVPSLRLWEVRDGGTNLVYSSAEEIEHIATQKVNAAKAELEGKMPRKAWGSYQSSGEDNPSSNSVTVVNSEKIMLTGGGEWYRAIETGGASVWVLKSRGLLTLGGDTNGYFRVCDAEGNAQIEVVKTADQTVAAIPSATDFGENDDFAVTFNASGSTHPKVSCATDLANDFEEEDDNQNINSLGISVSWDKNENDLWVATIHQDTRHTQLFLYGKMKVPGENLVRNNAPTSLDGGIYINNVKYRLVPYSTGGKTYLTLEVW